MVKGLVDPHTQLPEIEHCYWISEMSEDDFSLLLGGKGSEMTRNMRTDVPRWERCLVKELLGFASFLPILVISTHFLHPFRSRPPPLTSTTPSLPGRGGDTAQGIWAPKSSPTAEEGRLFPADQKALRAPSLRKETPKTSCKLWALHPIKRRHQDWSLTGYGDSCTLGAHLKPK